MPSLTNDSRKFFSASVRLGGVIDFVLVLGLIGTWIGCLARVHWFFALFDHFRLQASSACIIALITLSLRCRWWLVLFAAISLAVNAWPLIKTTRTLPAATVPDGPSALKLICFNALFTNTQLPEVSDYLAHSDADVIFILEFSPQLENALQPLLKTHPHGIRRADESPWGIGCYSRLPLTDLSFRTFADEEPLSISATVKVDEKIVRLIATHPWPPTSYRATTRLLKQSRGIAAHVSERRDIPAIVVGDFNATPWSAGIRELTENSQLDFRTAKPVWRPTWQVHSLLALPIDHALCTPPLFFETREIGPDLGSDHRPQELIVRWVKPATS